MVLFYPVPTAYTSANAMSPNAISVVPLMESAEHIALQEALSRTGLRKMLLAYDARQSFKAGSIILANNKTPAFLIVGCEEGMDPALLQDIVDSLSFMSLPGDIVYIDALNAQVPGADTVAKHMLNGIGGVRHTDINEFITTRNKA